LVAFTGLQVFNDFCVTGSLSDKKSSSISLFTLEGELLDTAELKKDQTLSAEIGIIKMFPVKYNLVVLVTRLFKYYDLFLVSRSKLTPVREMTPVLFVPSNGSIMDVAIVENKRRNSVMAMQKNSRSQSHSL
jgi:hypothetical protein